MHRIASRLAPPRRRQLRGGRGRGRGGQLPDNRAPSPCTDAPPGSAGTPAASPPGPLASPGPSALPIQTGLQALDGLDLATALRRRVLTFQTPPRRLQGLLAFAFRTGLAAIADHPDLADPRHLRGWKLFLLASRMPPPASWARARPLTGAR